MTQHELKQARKNLGLSVAIAAIIFKRSYSAWGKWERGERPVDEMLVVALTFYGMLKPGQRRVLEAEAEEVRKAQEGRVKAREAKRKAEQVRFISGVE